MAPRSRLLAFLARDYLRLADLYYQEGRLARAIEMYAKGGYHAQAAKLSVQLGLVPEAVEFFLKAGSPQQAGDLLANEGRHKEAIALYETAQAYWEAAESSLKLQQPARAGRYYERAQAWGRAAKCYEKAGMLDDALRVLQAESDHLEALDNTAVTMVRSVVKVKPKSHRSSAPAVPTESRREVDLHRAELLAKTGRPAEAAVLLRQWGKLPQAAPLFEKAGAARDAVEAYAAAEDFESALRLLDQAPDIEPQLAAEIYLRTGRHREAGEFLAGLGRLAEAAEAYEQAGDGGRAGLLWEQAHEPLRAAEAFHRAELLGEAGRCYADAGKPQLAAEAYASAGRPAEAASCYLRLGQPFRAATLFLEAGDKPAASQALQEIAPGGAAFEKATMLLVPLLLEEGFAESALRRLRMLPTEVKSSGTVAVDRIYWEGRVLEELGSLHEAKDTYDKVVALRRDHRDATERLGALVGRLAELRSQESHGMLTQPTTTTVQVLRGSDASAGGEQFDLLPPGYLLAERYEVLGELGRGGMSRVYKARDREVGETVAIKTLLRRPADSSVEEERLLRELQICRRIAHPNVVRVYDMGRWSGGIFITMEICEGTRLDELIRRDRPAPLARVRSILGDVLAGLDEAHRMGIVHRDLKPGNIMITATRLKILDFGIARMGTTDNSLTQTGEAMGSPMYMSPEQLEGEPLDGRSDLYALGVLAFALVAGREPFVGKTPAAVAMQHLQSKPPALEDFRPGVPAPWASFVGRLLAKQPGERYASAAEVVAALSSLPD